MFEVICTAFNAEPMTMELKTVTLEVWVCGADHTLLELNKLDGDAGAGIHVGVVPVPWLDRIWPAVPAELFATKAPDTTKFDEIVTAEPAAPKFAAFVTFKVFPKFMGPEL